MVSILSSGPGLEDKIDTIDGLDPGIVLGQLSDFNEWAVQHASLWLDR